MLHGEEGWQPQRGAGGQAGGELLLAGSGVQDAPEVELVAAARELGQAIDLGPEHRLVAVELAAHRHVLGAAPGVEEDHPRPRGPGAALGGRLA
ncbi:MAG: hypothetical protein U0002_09345 [Thermoanaerobaculia bacterium]